MANITKVEKMNITLNNPIKKYFLIDGEIVQVVKAEPCSDSVLPLWNIETSDGKKLEDWYPEYESLPEQNLKQAKEIVSFLYTHNRNYTKEQESKIMELAELLGIN